MPNEPVIARYLNPQNTVIDIVAIEPANVANFVRCRTNDGKILVIYPCPLRFLRLNGVNPDPARRLAM